MKALILILALIVTGCGTRDGCEGYWSEEYQEYVQNNSHRPENVKNAMLKGEIVTGMTQYEVQLIKGKPDRIYTTIYRNYTMEQWVYGKGYVIAYFKNGILEGWQEGY